METHRKEICHLTKLSVKCRTGHALVFGLRLLKTYDGDSFKAHEFCGKVHRCDLKSILRGGTRTQSVLYILKGSRGTNLYTISIDEMMKSSPICLLSKASKTISIDEMMKSSPICLLSKASKSKSWL
ncbi:hypothetical protein Tco_1180730 [Tanacetum coccineum]